MPPGQLRSPPYALAIVNAAVVFLVLHASPQPVPQATPAGLVIAVVQILASATAQQKFDELAAHHVVPPSPPSAHKQPQSAESAAVPNQHTQVPVLLPL